MHALQSLCCWLCWRRRRPRRGTGGSGPGAAPGLGAGPELRGLGGALPHRHWWVEGGRGLPWPKLLMCPTCSRADAVVLNRRMCNACHCGSPSASYRQPKHLCQAVYASLHPARAGEPELAWQLYMQQEAAAAATGAGGVAELLQLIANDCYRAGAFLWAARVFDALEYLGAQPGGGAGGAAVPPVWEGKRGACVAVFLAATRGDQPAEVLRCVCVGLGFGGWAQPASRRRHCCLAGQLGAQPGTHRPPTPPPPCWPAERS